MLIYKINLVKLHILLKGADINAKDIQNLTSLDFAFYHKNLQFTKILKEHGAKNTLSWFN